jgi:phosphohistidine phosphatase
MKHILLLRHAKSSWEDSSLDDFDRPLAKRGKKDAPIMGAFVKKTGYLPEQIYSSTAKRARQTTALFCKQAEIEDQAITWTDDFYYGSAFDYLEAIQNSPDDSDCIMLVGHNPKMEETASLLCSDNNSYTARMPTAALVCLEHPAVKWSQIREGTARIKWMVIPKLLKKL